MPYYHTVLARWDKLPYGALTPWPTCMERAGHTFVPKKNKSAQTRVDSTTYDIQYLTLR
jgi:hypothetical protein